MCDGRIGAEVVKRLFRDADASPSEVGNSAAHRLRRDERRIRWALVPTNAGFHAEQRIRSHQGRCS
jgi:hypothetical protein